jgi:hypothetical protein
MKVGKSTAASNEEGLLYYERFAYTVNQVSLHRLTLQSQNFYSVLRSLSLSCTREFVDCCPEGLNRAKRVSGLRLQGEELSGVALPY